jgi:hypothetical protein
MFHVRGTFVDSHGQPLQDVTAFAELRSSKRKPQAIELAVDASKFGFEVPANQWYAINFSHATILVTSSLCE